ncbi:hypothetical protein H5410_000552 [Solanum commersonii]|uniref:Uncharacterized protein n=1 Tax=Solanum commersonii TaxID=4109 RepID=A0A9J6AX90_SOLCO|nr:hypothetical protein H5410_000552 [Solanum commersonii]
MKLNLISVNAAGSIPKPLWNLTNIEELFLGDNHLEGPISDFFRFGKLRWTQLESLFFSFNFLTGPIPSNVRGMQNLQRLYLSSNLLNGTIPSWIFSLPSLEWLDMSDNHFSGNIPEFKSKTLDRVVLKQNHLQGPIPKSLLNQRVPQATTSFGLDQEEEEGDSSIISWHAVLMGYGCRLVIGLSIIYIMLSTQYPAWFSRMDDSSPLHCWDENKSF